ncbi:MAG TPA: SDR family oxidoreductase [Acidimicrobiales bacterium]|nr:SDR family oxidoreductase [Acidimicrobiales bacterium]
MRDLGGRTAVITGAGSGIGRATALALAGRGVNVVVADIDQARAEEVAGEVAALGPASLAVGCDVGSDADVEALRDMALARFIRIDILMNNVGILATGLPEDIPLAAWRRVLEVNVLGTVRALHAFIPDLIQAGEGHIITTASTAGLVPYAYDRLPYAASKAALVAIMENLALYLEPRGVGVTCVCPGPVATRIAEQRQSFGPDRSLQRPGMETIEASAVADLVVAAIEEGRFLLLTHPETDALMRAWADDPDGFLRDRITPGTVTGVEAAPVSGP